MTRLGVLLIALGLILVWAGSLSARSPLIGIVVGVADGDTIIVLRDRSTMRIRLSDLDAPEHGQPYGEQSKLALSHLVFKKDVTLVPQATDRYGRIVARVYVGSLDVNLAMVEAGYAWWYRQYSHDAGIAAAERSARRAQLGLWADKNPTAPWAWRQHGR